MMGLLCLFLVIALVLTIVFSYLHDLQKALSRVSPRNRLMQPGMVWLALIPLFNLVWVFFIATQVPDSLRNEFRDRGQDDGSDYGRMLGLINAILGVVGVPVNLLSQMRPSSQLRLVLLPLALVSLIVFILFWVKIAGYSRQLAVWERYEDFSSRYEDGDDHGGRRPRGKSSDAIRPEDEGHYQ